MPLADAQEDTLGGCPFESREDNVRPAGMGALRRVRSCATRQLAAPDRNELPRVSHFNREAGPRLQPCRPPFRVGQAGFISNLHGLGVIRCAVARSDSSIFPRALKMRRGDNMRRSRSGMSNYTVISHEPETNDPISKNTERVFSDDLK